MKAELICVGTELLLGDIVNTNAAYLSRQMAVLGFSCYHQSVVGDNEERLADALRTALARADVIILSGGLGPTQDDLTRETAAKVMEMPLALHQPTADRLASFFMNLRGMESDGIPQNNWRQAMVPEGAIVLENPNGTAPGLILPKDGKHLILLPGPPNELLPMFGDQAMPYLKQFQTEVIVSRTVKLCGIGESKAAEMIGDLIDGQTNPTIATYAKTGEVHLRVTAKAENEGMALQLTEPVKDELLRRFKGKVYTVKEEVSLEEALVNYLKKHHLSVAAAESCTGGLLAGRLINVAGVSEVFCAGMVTYSDRSKRKLLEVKKSTLRRHGAVSGQCAYEMAVGLREEVNTDVVISVTGIAGPDGGTRHKPVGLVYMTCLAPEVKKQREYHFFGNRAKIRECAVSEALVLLWNTARESVAKSRRG